MKYELKIILDTDLEKNSANLIINGVPAENEEINLLFTNSDTALSLYNDIVQKIYDVGKDKPSDVYEVRKNLNKAGKAIVQGIDKALDDHLDSKNIRKGVFVDSGLSWFDEASKYYKGLVEVQRRTYDLENLIRKLIENLLSMKNNDFISENEKKYIENNIRMLKDLDHTIISGRDIAKNLVNDWRESPKPFSESNEGQSENKTLKDFINDMYSNMRKVFFADSVSSPSESFKYDYNWKSLNTGIETNDAVDALTEGMNYLLLHKDQNDISNPSHYTQGHRYKPRKVIQDWGLDRNLGNTVKYISRAGRKGNPIKDLKRARQYLDWAIEERIIKTEDE